MPDTGDCLQPKEFITELERMVTYLNIREEETDGRVSRANQTKLHWLRMELEKLLERYEFEEWWDAGK